MTSEYLLLRYFDEFEVGDTQVTRGRTLTETDMVNWCMFTGDWFLLHSNSVEASASMFGQRILPGLMIQAIAGGLLLPAETRSVIANYGMDELRFPAATFVNDTIHVVLTVREKDIRPTGGLAKIHWDIRNQNDTTVCSCTNLALFHLTRPKEAPRGDDAR